MRQQFRITVNGQVVHESHNGKQAKAVYNEHDKKSRRETGATVLMFQDGKQVRNNQEIRDV